MSRIIAIFSVLLLFCSATGYSDLLEIVSSKLICQCGCTMVVATCQCEKAGEMRGQIRLMANQGKEEEQIIASFVNLYGEKVLGEPPKRGFNLLAYILPFAGFLTGGILIWWLVRKWTSLSHGKKKNKKTTKVDGEYQEKVRRELTKYDF